MYVHDDVCDNVLVWSLCMCMMEFVALSKSGTFIATARFLKKGLDYWLWGY